MYLGILCLAVKFSETNYSILSVFKPSNSRNHGRQAPVSGIFLLANKGFRVTITV